eukprot:TRINITY_DN16231_c2_g2_i2.p1 TRINITY_DN16231_c2_g2~~TRINITY_DN16231_c2_g2_i2.p1  ORF type:complete len:1558 (+),score=292.43 TRINITY_DN16231_c2_g2_i2:138-4811(+)
MWGFIQSHDGGGTLGARNRRGRGEGLPHLGSDAALSPRHLSPRTGLADTLGSSCGATPSGGGGLGPAQRSISSTCSRATAWAAPDSRPGSRAGAASSSGALVTSPSRLGTSSRPLSPARLQPLEDQRGGHDRGFGQGQYIHGPLQGPGAHGPLQVPGPKTADKWIREMVAMKKGRTGQLSLDMTELCRRFPLGDSCSPAGSWASPCGNFSAAAAAAAASPSSPSYCGSSPCLGGRQRSSPQLGPTSPASRSSPANRRGSPRRRASPSRGAPAVVKQAAALRKKGRDQHRQRAAEGCGLEESPANFRRLRGNAGGAARHSAASPTGEEKPSESQLAFMEKAQMSHFMHRRSSAELATAFNVGLAVGMAPVKYDRRRLCTGVMGALEKDKCYQRELLDSWRVAAAASDEYARCVVQAAQLGEFFDFMEAAAGEALPPEALCYVQEVFPRVKSIMDIDTVDKEMVRPPPEMVLQPELTMTLQQAMQVIGVLKAYAQNSKPPGKDRSRSSIKQPPTNDVVAELAGDERIYRPTFCRFLVDCKLIALDEESKHKPTYHLAARLFDIVASGGELGTAEVNTRGDARSTSLEQCCTIVGRLLGQIVNKQPAAVWNEFEEGLDRASKIADTLRQEAKERADSVVEGLAHLTTSEAAYKRKMDSFDKHGTPPRSFSGSVGEWISGLRRWVDETTEHCLPGSASERCEQISSFANYLRDALIQPDCLHVCSKYAESLRILFDAYADEERPKIFIKSPPPGSTEGDEAAAGSPDSLQGDGSVSGAAPGNGANGGAGANEKLLGGSGALAGLLDGLDDDSFLPEVNRRRGRIPTTHSLNTEDGDSSLPSASRPRTRAVTEDLSQALLGSGIGDEKKTEEEDSSEENKPPAENVTHMSFAAFFRFCIDFGIFPWLCSFEEVHAAYRAAECGEQLEVVLPPEEAKPESDDGLDDEKPEKPSIARKSSKIGMSSFVGLDDLIRKDERTASKRRNSNSLQKNNDQPPAGGDPPRLRRRMSFQIAAAQVSQGLKDVKSSKKASESKTESATPPKDNKVTAAMAALAAVAAAGGIPQAPTPPKEPVEVRMWPNHDFAWIHLPFAEMSPKRRRAFSLIAALCDASADHFRSVRGLLAAAGEIDSRGALDAKALRRGLESLHVEHDYETDEEAQEFLDMLGPQSCADGHLLSSELEKAVATVRRDRRWARHQELSVGGPELKARIDDLGIRARQLSGGEALDTKESKDMAQKASERDKMAFGYAAFVESVMMCALVHMSGEASTIKSSAPGGIMCLWLMSYIRHWYDQYWIAKRDNTPFPVVGGRRAGMLGPCRSGAASEASTRPCTRDSAPASGNAGVGGNEQDSKGDILGTTADEALVEPLLKGSSTYATRVERLLKSHPDLFDRVRGGAALVKNAGEGATPERALKRATMSVAPAQGSSLATPGAWRGGMKKSTTLSSAALEGVAARLSSSGLSMPGGGSPPRQGRRASFQMHDDRIGMKCFNCKLYRDQKGVGDVFCHVCSGVDERKRRKLHRVRRRQTARSGVFPSSVRAVSSQAGPISLRGHESHLRSDLH